MKKKKIITYRGFNRTRINDWLNDDERRPGCTKANVHFLRELKGIDQEFARVGILTYFLLTRLKVNDARAMLVSAMKQKKLVWAVILSLKEYCVDPEYVPVFEHGIEGLQKRCQHIYKICQLDLKETEHWPYFEKIGFDRLLDVKFEFTGDDSELDVLLPDMERWEAEHQDEIREYMESTKEQREVHRKWLEKKHAEAKAEKEARKAAKKAENAEVAEIKHNRDYWKKRNRELQRDLDRTVKRVHGGWNNGQDPDS